METGSKEPVSAVTSIPFQRRTKGGEAVHRRAPKDTSASGCEEPPVAKKQTLTNRLSNRSRHPCVGANVNYSVAGEISNALASKVDRLRGIICISVDSNAEARSAQTMVVAQGPSRGERTLGSPRQKDRKW